MGLLGKRIPQLIISDLGETRTLGPLIKSQLLYQLSYEVIDFYDPTCTTKLNLL